MHDAVSMQERGAGAAYMQDVSRGGRKEEDGLEFAAHKKEERELELDYSEHLLLILTARAMQAPLPRALHPC
jgi:hypothetical protein